jgi:hypothetical protein
MAAPANITMPPKELLRFWISTLPPPPSDYTRWESIAPNADHGTGSHATK